MDESECLWLLYVRNLWCMALNRECSDWRGKEQNVLDVGDDADIVIPDNLTPDINDVDELKLQIKEGVIGAIGQWGGDFREDGAEESGTIVEGGKGIKEGSEGKTCRREDDEEEKEKDVGKKKEENEEGKYEK